VRSSGPLIDRSPSPQPDRLEGSKFDTPEDLAAFAKRFDEGIKKIFSNNQEDRYVKFGSPRDNDPKYGIKSGRLTLTGYTHARSLMNWRLNIHAYSAQISKCFEPSIQSTVDCIRDDFSGRLAVNSVCLLGVGAS